MPQLDQPVKPEIDILIECLENDPWVDNYIRRAVRDAKQKILDQRKREEARKQHDSRL